MIACATSDGVGALGPEWDALFAAEPGVQGRRAWFEAVEAAALPDGARARWLTLRDGGRPVGLLPLRLGPGRQAASLASPYTVDFRPLLSEDIDPAAAGRAWGAALRAWPVATLEALDPEWRRLPALLSGFARAGLVAARFEHFGNWREHVAGWDDYLAQRPGALRETLRRKSRLAAKDASVRFDVAREPGAVAAALGAYEAVYARSWKTAEPHPAFNAALTGRMAAAGLLRLGLMWRGEVPVAAQYWTVSDGYATVLKLAHDDAFKPLSPGTLLTAHVIRGLLDGEAVRTLDFGRGDDAYKRQWAAVRRPKIGVMLANPWTPGGLAALARHAAGRAAKRLRRVSGG